MNRRVLLLTPLIIACGGSFYEPSPLLINYPERTPGRGWLEILESVKPLKPDYARTSDLENACRALAAEFPGLTPAQRLEKLDALTERNREGEFSAQVANLLIEMRELAGDDGAVQAAKGYLLWRCDGTAQPWLAPNQKPVRQWSDTQEQMDEKIRVYELRNAQAEEAMSKLLADIPSRLEPNAKVQLGALKMATGDFTGALKDFQTVTASFPGHPRSEIALFMTGRTLLEQARSEKDETLDNPCFWAPSKTRSDAVAAFQDYLRQYPTGRFVADANGWIGAAAADEGFYGDAVKHQLDRLEVRASRELLRSVLRDMEYLFNHLFIEARDTPDPAALTATLPWDQIARHPEVARLFLSHALDPTATDNVPHYFEYEDDNEKVSVLHQRIVLPLPFARCSLDSMGAALEKTDQNSSGDDLFTLEVLGWSALRDGHPDRALKLFDRALKTGKNEELLQGRAIAMTASLRHRDAAATYDELFKQFPDGTLTSQLGLKRAIAHCRAGEAGVALLDLLDVSEHSDDSKQYYDLDPRTEAAQWLDIISLFSPLEELAAPLKDLPPESPHAYALRELVRTRALAAERFDFAKQYLDPLQPPAEINSAPDPDDYYTSPPRPGKMDDARWNREIEPMAQAARETQRQGKGAALAELKLARLWRERHGDLLCHYVEEDPQRLENAKLLGLDQSQIRAALDSSYELFHARTHYLRAIALQTPATEVAAIDGANEILPELALLSPYRLARAVEMNETALSSKLADRLGKIAPGSYQAARAVKWNIQQLRTDEQWLPGNSACCEQAPIICEKILNPEKQENYESYDPDDPEYGQRPETPTIDLSAAAEKALPSMDEVEKTLLQIRHDYDSHRSKMLKPDIFSTGAALDDLEVVAESKGMTPDLFHRYAGIRLNNQPPPALEEEWAPLKSIFAYRDLANRLGRRHDAEDRDNEEAISDWEKYLLNFPNGPKTEAARLQLLRLQVYQIRPVPEAVNLKLPQPSKPTYYLGLTFHSSVAPGDESTQRENILKELRNYERDYPHSRYMADIKELRATLLADEGDFKTALDDLTTILNDPRHPELHQDAALRFAEIALRLRDPQKRAAVARAFKTNPAAYKLLANLANSDTCLFMLRPMMKWLGGPALALTATSAIASPHDWPSDYVAADGSRSDDGKFAIAVLDNRNLKLPAEEASLKSGLNYLVDLRKHQTLSEIPGVDFSYHPDSKAKLTVEWAEDSSWALAQYIEHFGMTHLVLLQADGETWSVKKIGNQIQELTSAAIEAKENVPLNVWIGADSDHKTLQLYAVGDDNPKSDSKQPTHPVAFSGRYDFQSGKWFSAKARAISQHEEEALLYFGRSDEKPEIWAAKMDEQLNSVYKELKTVLPEQRFRQLQEEQREWVADSGKAGSPAKENLRLAIRLHGLRDLLAHTLVEGE